MWTIPAIRSYYQSGQGTPRQLLQSLLTKIAKDKDYNAWIHVATLEELEPYFLNLEKKENVNLPLWGIPFAVKDNIDVAGMPTTAACPDYRYMPEKNADVVQRLIELGAVPLGKTNMDQFATGLVGTRSPYGVVQNPLHSGYISGGSSSGSAVAVALGHCAFSLGTDTAGSGRVPAAFCNLVGLKPSADRISTKGVVPACKSLDCVSIFTHSSEDAEQVFRCVDSLPDLSPAGTVKTLLFPLPEQVRFFGDQSYAEPWNAFVQRINSLPGMEIRTIDISILLETAKLLYEGPWIAERWAALGDFVYVHKESCMPVTRKILELGKAVTGAQVFQGMNALQEFQKQVKALFGNQAVLVLPTAGAIFTQAEVEAEPILRNQELGTYTNFMNLLKLCGLAVPAGKTQKGLSFGVTLVGMYGEDDALLQVSKRIRESYTLVAVCGAHMRGLPLNHELLECGAEFVRVDRTASRYRFFALATTPPKPGLVASESGGGNIELEIWRIPVSQYGKFVSRIPWPLGIGSVELEGGAFVQGFVCETTAVKGAREITEVGSWRRI